MSVGSSRMRPSTRTTSARYKERHRRYRLGAKAVAIAMSAALGATTAMAWSAVPSRAATARSLTILGIAGNDAIYNYDFLTASASSTNVDWTVNMMFRNNAEIDKVKAIIMPEFRSEGNIMDGRLKDGTDFVWDTDRGMKNPNMPTCPSNVHMRLYADGDDRMYNLNDGYYIFGTTHIDWRERCIGEEFGYSEDAEGAFVNEYRERGYAVLEDCCDWYNYEPRRYQGNHVWDNNGLTSIVRIP